MWLALLLSQQIAHASDQRVQCMLPIAGQVEIRVVSQTPGRHAQTKRADNNRTVCDELLKTVVCETEAP